MVGEPQFKNVQLENIDTLLEFPRCRSFNLPSALEFRCLCVCVYAHARTCKYFKQKIFSPSSPRPKLLPVVSSALAFQVGDIEVTHVCTGNVTL